jgi:superfamily II DNA or RNA helicase
MNGTLPEKKDTKVVLLFTPEEFFRNYQVLQSLQINKSAKGIDYTLGDLNRHEVYKQFPSLSQDAKLLLLKFQGEAISELKQSIEQRFAKQKAGISGQQFLTNALHRHFHQLFSDLRPYFPEVKWYHKIRKPDSPRYQTLPCSFHLTKARFRFDVIKQEDGLGIKAWVLIDDQPHDIAGFVRHSFFLEKDNRYYLLAYKDCQTLQWLEQPEAKQYAHQPAAFTEHVLARLESDYSVNRNGLFEEKQVETLPVCRVMLSELNNAFLMITPQWLYDGIVVDGPWKDSYETTLNGERIRVARHKSIEQDFLKALTALHPNFANQFNGYYYLSFAEAQKKQWFIKSYYKLLEMDIEVAGMDLLQHFKYSAHQAVTTVTIQKEQGSFVHLDVAVAFGKEKISLNQLQKTLYAGQRAIVLKDGSLGMLSDDWLRQHAAIIKHGTVKGNEIVVSKFLAIPESGTEDVKPILGSLVNEGWWQKWQRWQTASEPVYALPQSVSATLRPYQQKGFEWLALLADIGAGGCLADDMGLGKTLQTICFLAWYSEQYPQTKHLIVCPTSLIYNWQQELQKFAGSMKVEVIHGVNRIDNSSMANAQVLITSYGTLRSNREALLSQEFGVAVLDESHHIKNPAAQITRLVQEIPATIRIALSGTPVVNNTFDLYSQLNYSLPGLFGTREFFKREYADAIDRYGDEFKIKALQRLTAPFILRRTKEQVAKDLPEKTESVLWCEMGPRQEELYNEVKDQIRTRLLGDIQANGLGKSKLAVLQGLLKLRQICNDPQLLPLDEQQGCTESTKTEVLLEELSNLLGRHRVLVFSQFSSMLQLLARTCEKKGISFYLLDGQTPAEKRMQMVNNFQENADAPSLFFISLKAGNTGLTLTAADYVFLFDPWWNTAVEQQAIDRTYRIGQTKNVFSYKLICKNTIEEKIIELQKRKKQLAEELVSEDEGFVKALSEEDIAYLFS